MNTLDATTLTNIHSALKQQLRTVTGIPDDTLWAIENRKFDPPAPAKDAMWLRETFVPQKDATASLQGSGRLYRMMGSWLVDLFVPVESGTSAIDAVVSGILAAFVTSVSSTFAGQLVEFRLSFAGNGMPENGWFYRPVTVAWRADVVTP
jgi:hypothetical protein